MGVSKTERMHDLVIGLFINRYEFGVPFNALSTALQHLRDINRRKSAVIKGADEQR